MEPFIGQIYAVGFNFPPRGFASCNGQLLSIAQNSALFSLLGTTYGGDGRVTFGLPDLRGRVPIHHGQGPGLTNYTMGEASGEENHTLVTNEIPVHSHGLQASTAGGNTQTPANNVLATDAAGQTAGYATGNPNTTMSPQSVTAAGGNQPHNNRQPYLCINFVIALQGIFPSRN